LCCKLNKVPSNGQMIFRIYHHFMYSYFRQTQIRKLCAKLITKNTYHTAFETFLPTYRCHNTKHVHILLSQYKTCTPTAVAIQNIYTYRCHNTKHVHVQPFSANISAYWQDIFLSRCFTTNQ
jgi:hypothetical protein